MQWEDDFQKLPHHIYSPTCIVLISSNFLVVTADETVSKGQIFQLSSSYFLFSSTQRNHSLFFLLNHRVFLFIEFYLSDYITHTFASLSLEKEILMALFPTCS